MPEVNLFLCFKQLKGGEKRWGWGWSGRKKKKKSRKQDNTPQETNLNFVAKDPNAKPMMHLDILSSGGDH